MRLFLAVLFVSCATTQTRIDSRAECEAQCGSYGYGIRGYELGQCICDGNCARPKHLGGCEQLAPVTQNTTRM